ncbi:tyrosine--tRNA ligase [Alphaproteobacteria bacterium]|nr:tyrosine--tRNA ligase [Alphaproteobacteria bacterium]MDA8666687.1 tyrosine--tRNA ligase [Alphaproteobacteria bacterium]MDB2432324.1 tyrosine--tRNA ligase [Alphaproteobacteria bacterium]MDB2461836.1 tyrosine--tRNA ligase [Alphaproteobacteria bacterium]MDB2487108.1 tyrosine--tRNA ligase [Alphaproteobacteria bacterium]
MTYTSEFLKTLDQRGFIAQCTDDTALDAAAAEGVVTGYIGYDCTAPSLHVGNLISILMLRRLQQAGHRPIVVIGGGTTKVGDPSGKDESRQLLTQDKIDANKKTIRATFERFLNFGDGPTDAIMVDNDEWLSGLNYIEFLRDYGRHFSVNRMMSFESVKLRLEREQPLSFLEFNYMILQAYDFLELNRRYDCGLQMGGSDQWGNIVNGIELTRRCDQKSVYGLTTNLLTTSSGAKMGKTAQGAVWLNDDMLPVYDYWQFWRNTEDADVGRFLKLFTELPMEEIARLENLEGAELNDAKKILATEATAMCHGRAAAEKAEATALETFEGGGTSADLPSVDIDAAKLAAGLGLLEAFVLAGLAKSNGEARRLVQGGGAKINDAAQDDISVTLSNDDVKDGSVKLSFGKKRHVLLRPV